MFANTAAAASVMKRYFLCYFLNGRLLMPVYMSSNISFIFARQGAIAVFSILLASVFFIAGCSKKPVAMQNQALSTADNSQAPLQASTAASPAAAPASVPSITGEPAAPDLSLLTQALHIYVFQHKSMPKTVAELVAAGNIKNLPALPPGKKFEIDPKTTQVILVNQ
jgi:hypothetical protein